MTLSTLHCGDIRSTEENGVCLRIVFLCTDEKEDRKGGKLLSFDKMLRRGRNICFYCQTIFCVKNLLKGVGLAWESTGRKFDLRQWITWKRLSRCKWRERDSLRRQRGSNPQDALHLYKCLAFLFLQLPWVSETPHHPPKLSTREEHLVVTLGDNTWGNQTSNCLALLLDRN